MDLREGSGGVAGEAESLTEGAPVRSAEDVGVFNEHDGLALAGNAGAEERIQVVNLGQVCRHHCIGVAAKWIRECELRPGLMHLVHDMGSKIMQRDDAGHDRCKGRRNSRIADIANMPLAFNFEVVNFRLERFAHLDSGAGKINEHAAGVDHVDVKTMGFKPAGDGFQVGPR